MGHQPTRRCVASSRKCPIWLLSRWWGVFGFSFQCDGAGFLADVLLVEDGTECFGEFGDDNNGLLFSKTQQCCRSQEVRYNMILVVQKSKNNI